MTVARSKEAGGKEAKPEDTENVQVIVPKSPMKQFGLIMEMGPIAAVQTDSPAAEAGIQAGDLLKTVDGKPVADPMRLPDELHKRAGAEVALGLERGGKPLEVKVKLSSTPRYAPSELPDSPVAISELGISVFRAQYGRPRRAGQSRRRSRVCKRAIGSRKAKIIPPSEEQLAELRKKYHNDDLEQSEFTLPFADDERNWPCLLHDLQGGLPGTTVEFTWQRGDKEMTGKAAPCRPRIGSIPSAAGSWSR